MNKVAFVFPGQGAQYVGMGKEFYAKSKHARQIFDEANEALGLNIARLCFEGPEDNLMLTEHTQPAILATSVAILSLIKDSGYKCDYTAGLSLGEYTALVNAKSLEFSEAIVLVKNRGTYMQQAVPAGVGRMGAIIGLHQQQVEDIIAQASDLGLVEIANYNSFEQIVISGEKKAVSKALKLAKEYGAKKAVPLLVSAPFHCSLLEPAGFLLEKDISGIDIKVPEIPFISNVSAKIIGDERSIREHLIQQVSKAVLWRQSVELMIAEGVRYFIEIGPGDTLKKLTTSIAAKMEVDVLSESVSDFEGLNKLQEKFRKI